MILIRSLILFNNNKVNNFFSYYACSNTINNLIAVRIEETYTIKWSKIMPSPLYCHNY